MRKLVTILLVSIVLLAGGLAVAGPRLARQFSSSGGDNEKVRVEPAEDRVVIETIAAPGIIEPHTSVEISAEVSARITELPFREGDQVSQNDIVCRLDDVALAAQLAAAKAARDAQEFQLEGERARMVGLESRQNFAKLELERTKALFDSGDVAAREYEAALERTEDLDATIAAAKSALNQIESGLAAAEAEILRAESSLENTVIRSPIDGLITVLSVEVGEIVTGSFQNPGTRLMTVADLGRMVHQAEIAESDIARLELDQNADIHVNGYPDDVFRGRVRHIALQRTLDQQGTGFFRAEVELELGDRMIRAGHLANADIEITRHEGIAVPYQAIVVRAIDDLPSELRNHPLIDRTKRNTTVVYRIEDGIAKATPVLGGASDLTHRIVLDGLKPGESVIVGPYKLLEDINDGKKVTVEGDNETPDADADETDGAVTDSAPPATQPE